MNPTQFRKDLAAIINRNSMESGSDTPDFLLAEYLSDCLQAFDRIVKAREKWYGREKPSLTEMAQRMIGRAQPTPVQSGIDSGCLPNSMMEQPNPPPTPTLGTDINPFEPPGGNAA